MNSCRFASALGLATILASCASVSEVSDYAETKDFAGVQAVKLVICRPSSLFQMARRPDVYLNGSKITDIGSGEQIEVALKSSEKHTLVLLNSAYGTIFNPGKGLRLETEVSGSQSTHYILTVSFNSIDPLSGLAFKDITVSSNWHLQKVSPDAQLRGCRVDDIRRFAPHK